MKMRIQSSLARLRMQKMSNGQSQDQSMFSNTILKWIDDRFPLSSLIREHATEYYASKNFNIWYIFGVLSLVVLVIQLVTGIFLTMSYKPSAKEAFDSVEYIMRSVEWGWLIRYMHSTGSSFFFIVVYLHMFRAMLYGSYKKPRELVWIVGMLIYFCLIAEAFFGYLQVHSLNYNECRFLNSMAFPDTSPSLHIFPAWFE